MAGLRLLSSRWSVFIFGCYVMAVSGTQYSFPLWSSALKEAVGLTTTQINGIGTAANVGTFFSVIGGAFFDHFGPFATLWIGGGMISAGYLLLGLTALGSIKPGFIITASFAFLFGQGSGWTYTAALQCNIFNFPNDVRGKVVGSIVALFGLSGSIVASIYKGFFVTSVGHFLIALGIILPAMCILASFIICRMEPVAMSAADSYRLNGAFALTIGVALTAAGFALLEEFVGVPALVACIVLLSLLSLFLLEPLSEVFFKGGESRGARLLTENGESAPQDDGDDDDDIDITLVDTGPQYTLFESAMTLPNWLLFASFGIGVGCGLAVLNNLAQLVGSRIKAGTNPEGEIVTLVALFSVFNTFGRMGFGYVSDRRMFGLTRALFVTVACTLMGLTNFLFSLSTVKMMYAGVPLLGLAYGGLFSLCPTLYSEVFGTKHFGAIWGLAGLAPAVGSEVFGVLVAGYLYQHYEHTSKGGCVENFACYRLAFLINAGCCVVGALLGIALHYSLLREPFKMTATPHVTNEDIARINTGGKDVEEARGRAAHAD